MWEAIWATHQIPYGLASPRTWKPKDAALLAAKRLFPDLADRLARKKDVGLAEALLMADYARRKRG